MTEKDYRPRFLIIGVVIIVCLLSELLYLVKNKNEQVSRVFYKAGLVVYTDGPKNLTPIFFRAAIFEEPELSYYHVELANYYLLQGNFQSANKAINYCLKFKYPKQHCQDYLNTNIAGNYPSDVGFLSPLILAP